MILTDGVELPWISRRKDCPDIAGSESGIAFVIGSGHTLWDDIDACGPFRVERADVICVNDAGMHFPGPIKHWYSNDIQMLQRWIDARRPRYVRDFGGHVESHSCCDGAKHKWPWPGHGTSSLNAVFTALGLGYERVILCGVPLDDNGHYFDPPWVKTNFDREGTLKPWRLLAPKFEGRVKSMSGNSREILGAPS